MDLFDQYEMELAHKVAVIRQRINQLGSFQGEKKKVVITETEIQLESVREIYNKMDQLTRNASKNNQRKLQQKLRTFEGDLSKLQRDLQHASLLSSNSSSPSNNFRDPYSDDYQVKELDHRQKILAGSAKVEETSERLSNTHRIAVETERIGEEVLGEMYGQKKQLEGIRDNLDTVSDNAMKARTILSSMGRRVITNKLILAVVICVLLLTNGLIIYFKWINKYVTKKS